MFTMIVGSVTACASIGGILGGAAATLTGTSVATGSAVGTLAGAGFGLVAGIAEVGGMLERCVSSSSARGRRI